MKTLIAFELKKILNRKMLWVVLALGLGLMVWIDQQAIHYRTYGLIEGWRDVMGQYEGQVITDAFRQRVQVEYDRYLAGHAEHFEAYPSDSEGNERYFSKGYDYYWGVDDAYQKMISTTTQEEEQQLFADFQKSLASGTWSDGRPLDAGSRQYLQRYINQGVQTPAVHDAKGWEDYLQNGSSQLPGTLTMVLAALVLLGLFNGEAAARMEPVILTSKARQRLVAAKLLAGASVAVAILALYTVLHWCAFAWAYGLTGASLPANVIFGRDTLSLPMWQAFLLSYGMALLALLACAGVAMWASAQFRQPLLSLLVAGAVLGAMMGVDGVINIINNATDNMAGWLYHIHDYTFLLPASALFNHYAVFFGMSETHKLVFLVLCPVALTVLLCSLTQRAFLQQRKA